jgi:hypothetical protein
MKVIGLAILALPLVWSAHVLSQPTHPTYIPVAPTDRDILEVQRDYLAIPFSMQLRVLVDAARQGKIDQRAVRQPLEDAALNVSISAIRTGPVTDLGDRSWTDLITIPGAGDKIVQLDVANTDPEHDTYGGVTAHWEPFNQELLGDDVTLTMPQFLGKLRDITKVTYSRYATFKVALEFKGQKISYGAAYLFGKDDQSGDHVFPLDLYLQGARYSSMAAPYRPDHILVSSWRDDPVLHGWLLQHTVTDERCQQMNQLCCLSGKCGIRRSDFDRKMAYPVFRPEGASVPVPESLATPQTINCNPDNPDQCACDGDSCAVLGYPYSSSPPAQCTILIHQRLVTGVVWLTYLVLGVPVPVYHNWMVSNIRQSGYPSRTEEYDGGPSGNCLPSCGEVAAYADLPPQGHMAGDVAGGAGWYSTGTGAGATCEALYEIQATIAFWPYGFPYYPSSQNSNSVIYTAAINAGLNTWLHHPMGNPPGFSPGWGHTVP